MSFPQGRTHRRDLHRRLCFCLPPEAALFWLSVEKKVADSVSAIANFRSPLGRPKKTNMYFKITKLMISLGPHGSPNGAVHIHLGRQGERWPSGAPETCPPRSRPKPRKLSSFVCTSQLLVPLSLASRSPHAGSVESIVCQSVQQEFQAPSIASQPRGSEPGARGKEASQLAKQ